MRRLSRETDKSRKADTKRRTETAAAETEACSEDQDLQGGWSKLNLWMKHRGDKAFRPSFEDMTKLTDEMEDLHQQVDPQEEQPLVRWMTQCLQRMRSPWQSSDSNLESPQEPPAPR